MREIVLDTETTGLDPASGDRVVEIGCVELLNHIPTGRHWHHYFNPEREMSQGAYEVHGLSTEFLSDKPLFKDLADDFLTFIEEARLVIHNASFDIGFLNAELERIDRGPITMDQVVDTLALARRKHPGAANSLDALCKRYQIDNSARTKHGALLDSELLAEVYVELTGKRQARLELAAAGSTTATEGGGSVAIRPRPAPLERRLSDGEIAEHRNFVESLGSEALWNRYLRDN
ncbi:MAG: DNA polymerase III subunit epsilon [Methyloligellaceae bacterium]